MVIITLRISELPHNTPDGAALMTRAHASASRAACARRNALSVGARTGETHHTKWSDEQMGKGGGREREIEREIERE
jgi:hypothetical protein